MPEDKRSPTAPALSRRTVFVGAGVAGAVGAVAAVTAASKTPPPAAAVAAAAEPSGGYQLTDHVKQYYATARV